MSVLENISQVRRRIDAAARRAGRHPGEIKLVAVTKTVPVEAIREALACGINSFGENRVQEFLQKVSQLPAGLDWHLIGHLQTNKVKKVIGRAHLIHSLDRWSLAEEIDRAAQEVQTVARVLVQVNVAGEDTKYGLALSEVEAFVAEASQLPGIEVCGLMTIAPRCEQAEEVRPYFRQLRELARRMKDQAYGAKLAYLSMGMTGDFEVAVEEGAHLVRVGTAIFGQRD